MNVLNEANKDIDDKVEARKANLLSIFGRERENV
jgi:hypothetical protein